MGCIHSSEEKATSKSIEALLEKDKRAEREQIKMLMLGAGESGKTTLMRLMYSTPFSDEERASYREVVWANTLESMQGVLEGYAVLELPFPASLAEEAAYISGLPGVAVASSHNGLEGQDWHSDQDAMLDPAISACALELWKAQQTKDVVRQSNKFDLNDSAAYFFDELERISQRGYLPTTQDILRTRVRSVGIVEEHFNISDYTLKVVDVGGQRSERRKWIHCFEGVGVLEFVAAISEYDQVLYEDESMNRLQEALVLFDSVACSQWFDKSTLILLLNKVDLFAAKLPHSLLSHYFPQYTGGDRDLPAATRFMRTCFEDLEKAKKSRTRSFFVHVTCATDTKQVQVVVGAVMDRLLQNLLVDVGLV